MYLLILVYIVAERDYLFPPIKDNRKEKPLRMVGTRMKKIKYVSQKQTKKLVKIPNGKFASDWFVCRNCGYEVMIKTLTNTVECSECGGTMDRK